MRQFISLILRPVRKRPLLYATMLIASLCMMVSNCTIPVYAHVLQSNNGVSAVLHIEPDDDPIAGVSTTIGLEFNSTNPNFNLKDYTVTANVRGTSVDASEPPAAVTSDSGTALYGTAQILFPDPGSYTLNVKGAPNTSKQLSDFNLTFEIRAERPQAVGNDPGGAGDGGGFDSLLIGIAALGLLGVLAQYQIRRGGRYDK